MKSMQAKLGDIGREVVHILHGMQCSRMPRGDPGSAAHPRVPSAMAWDSAEPGDQRHEKIRLWRRRALAKRGVWLHTNMTADAQSSHLTRRAWRRRLHGSACCGTFFVEPLILREGRVQRFSYISSATV